MRSVGLCIGASTISTAEVEVTENGWQLIEAARRPHHGKPEETFRTIIDGYQHHEHVGVTGRSFKDRVRLPTLAEPEAIERAYQALQSRYPDVDVIVSAGGEIFVAYELDAKNRISDVYTGNKCASGTGEFFLQQIQRMGLTLEEAAVIADTAHPHVVAGRCSVFCKSDCTHALNKGESKARVVSGLSRMMADKILELLHMCGARRVMLIGGTAQNDTMVHFLSERVEELVVPEEAGFFEALGTALWAADSEPAALNDGPLLQPKTRSFAILPALADHTDQVAFHELKTGTVQPEDRCIVGLDVGSTTTKAVLMRTADRAVLASTYLRTNGDPVSASRQCYAHLRDSCPTPPTIIGLGVTGSGRQIAGLHAMTKAVINEIIAHATAAVYFDPDVDTILEIGGQDAKYTYISGRVPTDYAMNEACSAGTGSFLEEAARESLQIATTDIADQAMRAAEPPNFNDQCSAFISSDIKVAVHEGLSIPDICAGLVYSVCQNYNNRVKGNRPVGRKVFMQGGVCYNRAVPVAMSVLLGRDIVVPPEPGLMGAFGVALEVLNRQEQGILEEAPFDLDTLVERDVVHTGAFVCQGGPEKCDRQCSVALYEIDGRRYPFGGACNRYVNQLADRSVDPREFDLVSPRDKQMRPPDEPLPQPTGRIALTYSLGSLSFTRFFAAFFRALNYEVLFPDSVQAAGLQRQAAAFCYPVEVAHGLAADLLTKDFDYLWLPQIKRLPTPGQDSITCPLAQGEPYYLKAAFPELAAKLLTPVLEFTGSWAKARAAMLEEAARLGTAADLAAAAWDKALGVQEELDVEQKAVGRRLLDRLADHPDEMAVVLFGRPYNAFTSLTNMAVPHKFASRGCTIVPYDSLPFEDEEPETYMYWSHGQRILQAAKFVRNHPQLFPVFVTNFSCGPDSFIVSDFQSRMVGKPSLVLELDSHSADAGIDTRIEAYLDIVDIHRRTNDDTAPQPDTFQPARLVQDNGGMAVVDSQGRRLLITDPRVRIVMPSMGDLNSEAAAAALRYMGARASAAPPPGERELKLGRGNSSCKECLPLQMTVGSLLRYIEDEQAEDEVVVYFMPTATGPCRFGQYNVVIDRIIRTQKLENVTMLTLSAKDAYAGFTPRVLVRVWQALVIGDTLDDIRNSLRATAQNPGEALALFVQEKDKVLDVISTGSWSELKRCLRELAATVRSVPLSQSPTDAPRVFITGEIYVRQDEFSRQKLVEKLAQRGIIAHVAPIHEWGYYIDHIKRFGQMNGDPSMLDIASFPFMRCFKQNFERQIKSLLKESGHSSGEMVDIPRYMEYGSTFMSSELTGEAILTIGGTFAEIVDHAHGVLALGPFGCMPNRIAEAILYKTLQKHKAALTNEPDLVRKLQNEQVRFPFLSIETDGNVFPPVISSRFEVFCLQVKRLHQEMQASRKARVEV